VGGTLSLHVGTLAFHVRSASKRKAFIATVLTGIWLLVLRFFEGMFSDGPQVAFWSTVFITACLPVWAVQVVYNESFLRSLGIFFVESLVIGLALLLFALLPILFVYGD
jgi:hypothetical protein